MATKKRATTVYVCASCGEEYIQWQGRCTTCGEWNTLKEIQVAASAANDSHQGYSGEAAAVQVLADVTSGERKRHTTGFAEVDRVLGGGFVQGSVLLLGGDPGIGKSTLLLQLVEKIATAQGRPVLYVSGEESPAQIKLRAERLGLTGAAIELMSAVDVTQVAETAMARQPALLVVDSIQTMYDPAFPSTPGSLVQVRESALRLQRMAKTKHITTVLVGHITKEGTVAGPRTLEHMVDVVLYLEGDSQHQLRVLRAVKNRFGDIAEAGIFAMRDRGMVEVANPGSFLLSERALAPGSVLSSIIEGTRPMLIELQALTVPTSFGNPRRTASGFDLNRLNLLIAVLQKHAGLNLAEQDVFVNVVGGIKVKDPAVDAAVCMAIASSLLDRALPEKLCVIGEVGLAGELRSVSGQARRTKEIEQLGYSLPPQQKRLAQLIGDVLPKASR